MKKLILYDVDGTLIDTGGAGLIALNKTLERLTGLGDGMKGVNPAGKTDLQILREALANQGKEPTPAFVRDFIEEYPQHLEAALKQTNGAVKPGVTALLERKIDRDEYCVGLLTGNLEAGARLKLTHYSLWHYFKLGAYGSDNEDRNGLVRVAVQRYHELFGDHMTSSQCVIIGDTPRDVACARANRVPCLVVATGKYDYGTLRKSGADLVLHDLSDTDLIMEWLADL